ncbi:MAG: hypothetical protein EOP37_03160 [Rubrivivax sp.]|nr:MAG: hypothetical protein EOP37_03160 [Rubrivivax sp.]
MAKFVLAEERDEETRRVSRVARLQAHPHYPARMPPPLFDATLIHASGGVWTVSGHERESVTSTTTRCTVQSWYMRPLSASEELELEERFKREMLARLPAHMRG